MRSVIAVCRRLHRRFKARSIALEVASVDRRIERLREDIDIDDRLAATMRKLYEKSPTLQHRRAEDRKVLAALLQRRQALEARMLHGEAT